MSPAEARFQLLQGGSGPADRAELLCRIRNRWGEAAAQETRERVENASDQESEHWLRRSAYFLDLASMLDLECSLPVRQLGIHDLLDFLTAEPRPILDLLFVRFARFTPQDWRQTVCSAVPWLADLPDPWSAIQHLQAQGWLLIGCDNRKQGFSLLRCVRPGRGILAKRYGLAGANGPHRKGLDDRG